jgi:hypothetical protein
MRVAYNESRLSEGWCVFLGLEHTLIFVLQLGLAIERWNRMVICGQSGSTTYLLSVQYFIVSSVKMRTSTSDLPHGQRGL